MRYLSLIRRCWEAKYLPLFMVRVASCISNCLLRLPDGACTLECTVEQCVTLFSFSRRLFHNLKTKREEYRSQDSTSLSSRFLKRNVHFWRICPLNGLQNCRE